MLTETNSSQLCGYGIPLNFECWIQVLGFVSSKYENMFSFWTVGGTEVNFDWKIAQTWINYVSFFALDLRFLFFWEIHM